MRKRTPTNEADRIDANGNKRYVNYQEGAEIYSMGTHSFMILAKESKAVRKIGRSCLVNVKKLNEYIEDMYS